MILFLLKAHNAIDQPTDFVVRKYAFVQYLQRIVVELGEFRVRAIYTVLNEMVCCDLDDL